MTEGLKFVKYVLLKQENDPLEYCVCTLPISSNIGIPQFPCELPNNFNLFQSNEIFSQLGMKIMDIELEENHKLMRKICCLSLRPLNITSRDFNNNIPIQTQRKFAIPLIQKNEMKVKYDGEYAGKFFQEQYCSFMKGIFHQLFIYDSNELMLLQIKKDQYDFYLFNLVNLSNIKQLIKDLLKNNQLLIVIQIIKLNIYSMDGLMNIIQKADQYGIKFPDSACEKDKALIIMYYIFIDYLWFENF